MTALPPADPLLVAETVAALPKRLQGRLDAAVAAASSWAVEIDRVVLPGAVEVMLLPEHGVLRRAEHVRCACLLAPACLHRASVLAAAPVAGPDQAGPVPDRAEPAAVPPAPPAAFSAAEQDAARRVRLAASRVLEAGAPATGAALQSELLLALHLARLSGLHRLAAAATRTVTGVRALREDLADASLDRLSAHLLDVLETAQAIESGQPPHLWRGTARTAYEHVGGLRLTGLGMEPVVTDSGYAGVVVHLLDAGGRLWSVSDVQPGGPGRVRSAAHGPVAVGESGLSHRQLSRAGLMLSGATANADGRLGAGSAVRAVAAPGARWTDEPLRSRFGAATGAPLMLLDLALCGSTDAALLAVDAAGTPLRLVAPKAPGGRTIEDLRLLASAPGLRLLAVARPGGRYRTVELLAVGGDELHLPDELAGRADLGLDRLSPAYLRPTGEPPPWPGADEPPDPLLALRRRWQRVVSGGRRTLTLPGVERPLAAESDALRGGQLPAGATALAALATASQVGERDVFGRASSDGGERLALAWLATGVYARSVSDALEQQQWRSSTPS